MATTINTALPPDAVVPAAVPSPPPSRRSKDIGERFDDHLDRAIEAHERSAPDAGDAPPQKADERPAAHHPRVRVDRQHHLRRQATSPPEPAVSDSPSTEADARTSDVAAEPDDDVAAATAVPTPMVNVVPTPAPAVVVPTATVVTQPKLTIEAVIAGIDGASATPDTIDATGGSAAASVAPSVESVEATPARTPTPAGAINPTAAAAADAPTASGIVGTATATTPPTTVATVQPAPLPTVPDATAGPTPAPPTGAAVHPETPVVATNPKPPDHETADVAATAPQATTAAPATVAGAVVAMPVVAATEAAATTTMAAVDALRALRTSAVRATRVASGTGSPDPGGPEVGQAVATAEPVVTALAPATSPSATRATTATEPPASAFSIAAGDADLGVGASTPSSTSASAARLPLTDLAGTGRREAARAMPMSLPELSMDLSDEGLGPLSVQASNSAGLLHLKLTAGDRMVGDMLSRAGGELRRDLESSGTVIGTLDIGHSGADHTAAGQGEGRFGGHHQPTPTRTRVTSTPIGGAVPSTTSALLRSTKPVGVDGVDVRI